MRVKKTFIYLSVALFPLFSLAKPIKEICRDQSFVREYIPVGSKDFAFEDETIYFRILPRTASKGIPLIFQNKSEEGIRILWDETAFVNGNGKAEKVIHEGILLKDKSLTQMPTIVPPGSRVEDSITPVDRIMILPISKDWGTLNICGDEFDYPEIGTSKDEDCLGKTFSVFLTYEIKGQKKSKMIKFKYEERIPLKVEPIVIMVPSKPSIPATPTTPAKPSTPSNFKFGLGIGTSLKSTVKGSIKQKMNAPGITASSSGPVDEEIKSSLYLSVFMRNLPENSLGFIGSFEYTPARDIEDFSGEISSGAIKANLAYRNKPVYFFGGGNISFHKLEMTDTPAVGYSRKYDASGGLGFQAGLGVFFNDHVSLEAEYETIKFDMNIKSTNPGTQIDTKLESYVESIKLGLKIAF